MLVKTKIKDNYGTETGSMEQYVPDGQIGYRNPTGFRQWVVHIIKVKVQVRFLVHIKLYNGIINKDEKNLIRNKELSERNGGITMNEVYITVTGMNHYYGKDFVEPGMNVHLVKDVDNEFDKEAIKVEMDGIGKVGYVANSPCTVIGESMSAGRIYDRIADKATAKVLYVLPQGLLCTVDPESILAND